MFDAVDMCLLLWTGKIVKRWSWATGKDQFALARTINNIGFTVCIGYMMCSLIMQHPAILALFVGAVMYSFLSRWRYDGDIFIAFVEFVREQEALRGAKSIEFEMLLSRQRKKSFLLIGMCWMVLFTLSGFRVAAIVRDAWFYAVPVISLAVAYVVSVDRPPYKRSRLRRLAGFLLKKLVRKVIPEPEPEALPAPS